MNVRIFQLPAMHDRLFSGFDEKHYPNLSDYKEVYSYTHPYVMTDDIPDFLEDVFAQFNLRHPEDFKGRSLSVSDIVVIEFLDSADTSRIFFCNNVGWKELDPEKMGYTKLTGWVPKSVQFQKGQENEH